MQRTSFTPWYHLNLPRSRGLIRSRQTVSAISGAPVSAYWSFQQSRSERNSAQSFLLPCTERQFSGRRMVALTGFHHRVYFNKFTTFFVQSQRKTIAITPKKPRESLCSMPRNADFKGENSAGGKPLFRPKEHRKKWDLWAFQICADEKTVQS